MQQSNGVQHGVYIRPASLVRAGALAVLVVWIVSMQMAHQVQLVVQMVQAQ
jgi:hypothetical protein